MQTPNSTLTKMWELYKKLSIHPLAGPEQLLETEMAFFSGMYSMLILLLKDAQTSKDIENLRTELKAHAERLNAIARKQHNN